ncbi:MAG: response regulator, partial [Gemmatimonadales bacterium]|nr:response regulator [Gemmatimonadales bacterium]
MKVTALIADDEPVARAGLRDLLADIDWISCVGETANGPATVAAIDELRPELVFLDVQMPGLTGLEVLERIRHRPHVVFTTAFGHHAVSAFELGALDYLLKPFGADR